MEIGSYGKIYNIGHAAVKDIFKKDVLVEEKLDGSQGSCAILEGELKFRSKGAIITPENPNGLFNGFVQAIQDREHLLTPGWVYRGEVFQKPKHNALTYNRIPQDHFIIFDIMVGQEDYLPYEEKAKEAHRLGLEIVPKLYEGPVTNADFLFKFLERESILGGPTIEGVVLKAYGTFNFEGKTLMAKHVSEAFKETNRLNWKQTNQSNKDILETLGAVYNNDARWQKSIIHLREQGLLENSPKDIGKLIKEVQTDILAECEDDIKERLWNWAKGHVLRKATAGLPEWYKNKLVEEALDGSETTEE